MSEPYNSKEEAEAVATALNITDEDVIKYIDAKLQIAYNAGQIDFMREQMEANNLEDEVRL